MTEDPFKMSDEELSARLADLKRRLRILTPAIILALVGFVAMVAARDSVWLTAFAMGVLGTSAALYSLLRWKWHSRMLLAMAATAPIFLGAELAIWPQWVPLLPAMGCFWLSRAALGEEPQEEEA